MNLKIYTIGDKPAGFHIDAVKEYEKRLSRYCRIQLIEIKEPESLSKRLSDRSYKIEVSTAGKQLSSTNLAAKINGFAVSGISDLEFVIGPGKAEFDEGISISPMDMSTGMMAVIMFEQIYRAYRILNNEPYHK